MSRRCDGRTVGYAPSGGADIVAELLETRDMTAAGQSGWTVEHYIRRRDGQELRAEVRCWNRAHERAVRKRNLDALEHMEDRGVSAALAYAELVDSPEERGAVVISIWFDVEDDGNLRRRVIYEHGQS
jgi:hypothetical protein